MRLGLSSHRRTQSSLDRLGAMLACMILTSIWTAPLLADERIVVRGPLNVNEAKIAAAMKEETEFEFLETPLQEVLDFLREYHDIEIEVDITALENVGIGTDTPVTRNLKGVALRSALNLTLRDLELAWVVRDKVLLITTEEVASEWLEVRVYNVTDFVVAGVAADELAKTVEAALHTKRGGKARDEASKSVRALKTLLFVRDSKAGHGNVVDLLAVLRGS